MRAATPRSMKPFAASRVASCAESVSKLGPQHFIVISLVWNRASEAMPRAALFATTSGPIER